MKKKEIPKPLSPFLLAAWGPFGSIWEGGRLIFFLVLTSFPSITRVRDGFSRCVLVPLRRFWSLALGETLFISR